MYKTIICAIEASEEGREILAKAHQYAQMCNAKLYVTHIIPYTVLPKDYQKELEETVTPQIESIVTEFGLSLKSVTIKFGKPYEEICSIAERREADLIIIGTHSKKGIHAFMGSTANAVAHYAKCDVSLIKI